MYKLTMTSVMVLSISGKAEPGKGQSMNCDEGLVINLLPKKFFL